MKQLTLLAAAIIISAAAFCQSSQLKTIKEGVMKKDGKMWYIKALTGPMTLENGIIVNTDGTLKNYNNKINKLADGECINFKGDKTKLSHKMDVKGAEIVMNNNSMWVWSVLQKPIHLSNGTYIMPDGTLKLQSGSYQDLKDKDFVDFDGNLATVSL
jgi:hypothetical protein